MGRERREANAGPLSPQNEKAQMLAVLAEGERLEGYLGYR
jgi:hypothetical protein